MSAVAVTDHGAMFGTLRFYEAARAAGVSPIIGVEAYVAPGSRFDRTPGESEEKYHHLTLLAEDEIGLSEPAEARLARPPRGLLPPAADGQAAARRARRGRHLPVGMPVVRAVGAARSPGSRARARDGGDYRDIFGPTGTSSSCRITGSRTSGAIIAQADRARAVQLDVPLVATNDLHYTLRSDAKPHDVLLCIQQQKLQTRSEAAAVRRRGVLPEERRRRCDTSSPSSPRRATTRCGSRNASSSTCGSETARRRDQRYHLPRFETAGRQAPRRVPARARRPGRAPLGTAPRSRPTSAERIDDELGRHHADGLRRATS